MGYQNEGARRYLLDIETAAIVGAEAFLPLDEIAAPANYKDPDKIAAYVSEKRLELLSKAALDFDLLRVVALGFQPEDGEGVVWLCPDEDGEATALRDFWKELAGRTTIGYNQLEFDLPALQRRSWYLGVDAPALNLDRYRSPHLDLQQRLSLNGKRAYRSLNWYCRRFGLVFPEDVGGKDIGALVAAGEWPTVQHHCLMDLAKTRALAMRLGLL